MFEKFGSFFGSEKCMSATLTTGALLILGIPVGIAVFVLGFAIGENPCIMCWDERTGMMFLGVLMLFMVRYGIKMKYLAAYALWCFYGLYMAMRHVGNLIWRDLGQGFGSAIFGIHTYGWALFVYWVAVLSLFLILLFLWRGSAVANDFVKLTSTVKKFTGYGKSVVVVCFIVIVSNAFQALIENGMPPYAAIGRPARFTLDLPKAAHNWSYAHWWGNFAKVPKLRGPWDIEMPYIAGANEKSSIDFAADAHKNTIAVSGNLKFVASHALPFESRGFGGASSVAGFDYNVELGKFGFLTTNAGVFYTDRDLKTVTDSAIFDYPNGNDIVKTVDAAFVGNKLIGMAYNKTLYGNELKDPSKIDAWWQWRIFREATPSVAPVWGVVRPWLSTARAHLSFVTNMAYDKKQNLLYSAAVPNNQNKCSILLAFDMFDRQVVAERNITTNGRTPADCYITGLVVHNDKLLAVSKKFHLLLVINPQTAVIETAFALPQELKDPHSLTVVDGKLLILDRQSSKDVVCELELPQI